MPVLAIIGLLGGIAYVVRGSAPLLVAQPVAPPTVAPYPSYIAGSGMLEASTRNIAISTPVGGVIREVLVKVSDRVRGGQPLFRVDGRDLEAQLAVREAAEAAAQAQILEAQASLAQARDQLKRGEGLSAGNAITLQDIANRRFTVQLDEAKLGTARANAESADALVQETKTNIGRLTIEAPLDGDVLQLNIRPGEYAQTGVLSNPLVLLGDTRTLHVRVDIDENDAWRLRPGMPAKAFLRGNSAVAFDLSFAYVEPYVVPKTELSGASTERVDTRVLQIVYSARKGDLPIYAGQQVDVYIETPSDQATSGPFTAPAAKESAPGQ
jgi:RND family efflux transporter MFP subunit